MNYIKPETLEKIKEIDLLTYFRLYEPNELVHISHETYSVRSHDSIRISNGMWVRFSNGDGGRSALDYLIKVKGMKFLEAVQFLLDKNSLIVETSRAKRIHVKPKQKTLLLPERYKSNNNAIRYLTHRKIDKEVIKYFVDQGVIYETCFVNSKTSSTFHNVVFVGKDKNNVPRYASIRGIDTQYKGEASGSDKRFPFCNLSEKVPETVHVFESAIDMLSGATLMKMWNVSYKDSNLLSLAGIYQPQKVMASSKVPVALEQYLKDNPDTKFIMLHLDNDEAGRLATQALQTVLDDKHTVVNSPPACGKDYNDYLKILKAKSIHSR